MIKTGNPTVERTPPAGCARCGEPLLPPSPATPAAVEPSLRRCSPFVRYADSRA
jgi:hypothetical protein